MNFIAYVTLNSLNHATKYFKGNCDNHMKNTMCSVYPSIFWGEFAEDSGLEP